MSLPQAAPSSLRPRIDPLTSLRFFAAIAVVLYHFWPVYLPDIPTPRLFESGFMGVSCFYILSGYILGFVYLGGARPKIDRQKFWVARLARVYPSYALSLLLRVPLVVPVVLHSGAIFKKALVAAGTFLANLLLLQAWAPVLNWRWNPPSWSVSVEVFFYALFPALAAWSTKTTRLSRLFILIAASYVLMLFPAAALLSRGIGLNSSSRPELFQFVVFSPICRLPEFMMGLLLFGVDKQLKIKLGRTCLSREGAVAFAGGALMMTVIVWFGRSIPFILRYNGIADPAMASIIFGLANTRGWLLRVASVRFLVLLGEASYSIYILQAPLFDWFRVMCSHIGVEPRADYAVRNSALFGAYVVGLIGVSIASFRYLESPGRRFIKRLAGEHMPVRSATESGANRASQRGSPVV